MKQDFTLFKVKLSKLVIETYRVEKEDSTFIFFSLPRVDGFQTIENITLFIKKKIPPEFFDQKIFCGNILSKKNMISLG